jgi:hypothetical protein
MDGYGQVHSQGSDGTFSLSFWKSQLVVERSSRKLQASWKTGLSNFYLIRQLGNGGTVRDVIRGMGVPLNRVAVTALNGRKCQEGLSPKPGDRVILIPQDR